MKARNPTIDSIDALVRRSGRNLIIRPAFAILALGAALSLGLWIGLLTP